DWVLFFLVGAEHLDQAAHRQLRLAFEISQRQGGFLAQSRVRVVLDDANKKSDNLVGFLGENVTEDGPGRQALFPCALAFFRGLGVFAVVLDEDVQPLGGGFPVGFRLVLASRTGRRGKEEPDNEHEEERGARHGWISRHGTRDGGSYTHHKK